jgi:hypothetical protein
MKNKLIDYHYEWLESGRIPYPGLCITLHMINREKYKTKLDMFHPNSNDLNKLYKLNKSLQFWASDLTHNSSMLDITYKYTKLRQTIVLFICAMCDEL